MLTTNFKINSKHNAFVHLQKRTLRKTRTPAVKKTKSATTAKANTEKKTTKSKQPPSTGNKNSRKRKKPISDGGDDGFIASDSFVGAKPGYVFQAGSKGIGYYLNNPPQPTKSDKKRKKKTKPRKSTDASNTSKINGTPDLEDVVVSNKDFVSLTNKKAKTTSTVVYLGHIPHGFYEEQVCLLARNCKRQFIIKNKDATYLPI